MAEFRRAAIIGVGMVGGSLGRALLTRGVAEEVVGIDQDAATLQKALELGAVTAATQVLVDGVRGAGLVVLAAPVMATLALLPQIAPFLAPGTVVTDVGSTKAVIMEAANVLPETVSFVGGHPMAGSEKAGVAFLDANLFENAIYVLTGGKKRDALKRMERVVSALGAVPLVLEAKQHDRLVAAISHLPHLAATALVETVAALREEKNELLALAAGGFRDTTRVAMGGSEMWKDICLTNREPILELLDVFLRELEKVRAMVAAGDGESLADHFRDAREFRLQVPSRGKGILPAIYNLYVYVPDKPGIIGEVAGRLGSSGLNIAEIELLRVREEEGGPLRLGFMREESRSLASGLLRDQGFRVEWQEG